MSPVLPFDIITVIIDIVGENKDTDLLKELALVSHSFLHICREHLFATVELHDSGRFVDSRKIAFVELLESSPDVVKYIRKLTYIISRNYGFTYDYDRLLSVIFLDSFPKISRLNCLAISAANLNWNKLDSSVTSALIRLMHLPTINHIDLSYIQYFPLFSLTLSVNLHRLDISHLKLYNPHEDDFSEIVVEMIPKIREFHTSGSSQVTTKLLDAERQDGQPAFNFMDLKRLSMTLDGFVNKRNIEYLFQNAKLLEELHLSVVHGTSLVGILSLSVRSLKVLDLSAVPLRDEGTFVILGGICEELEALAGQNMLETLSLEVRVSSRRTEDFVGYTIQQLEKVLVKPGWSMLRQVSLKVSIMRPTSTISQTLCETLQSLPDKYLSHLSNLESVAFDYSVYGAD